MIRQREESSQQDPKGEAEGSEWVDQLIRARQILTDRNQTGSDVYRSIDQALQTMDPLFLREAAVWATLLGLP
jgi:hypothetical protein